MFWNLQAVTRDGVLLNAGTTEDEESLRHLDDFLTEALQKEYIPRRNLCLELGCGGPLLIYRYSLIRLFKRVDICDISRE